MIYLLFEWWFTYFTCRSMLDDLKVRSPVFPHYITIYINIYYIYPIIYWQNPVIYPWFPHYIPYDINIYIHSGIIPKKHLPKFFLNICTSFPYDITICRVLFSMSLSIPSFRITVTGHPKRFAKQRSGVEHQATQVLHSIHEASAAGTMAKRRYPKPCESMANRTGQWLIMVGIG